MNIRQIINRFFTSPKSFPPSNSWGGWLDTAEGKRWEAIGCYVYKKLDSAKISAAKRQIIVEGKKLTLNQSISRVFEGSEYSREEIREHSIIWLEEAADPIERDEYDADDDAIDDLIVEWVNSERELSRSH